MAKKAEDGTYPWDIQEGESAKNFEAFNKYLLMGQERSLRKLSYELNKSVTLLGRWSSKFRWGERVDAWDVEQDRLARLDQLEDIKKMRKRHATIATTMLAKVSKRMMRMSEEELTPQDLKAWVDVASKLERISRGDSGEVVEERDGGQAINPVHIYIPDNNRDGGDTDGE